MRIVSLVPSATEIVCALGLTDALVGISHDCDFPPEVRGKPVLSEAVTSPIEPSRAIEGRIRSMVHSGRSVYHLDATVLARLHPDLILTQELCAVCAPSSALVRQAATLLDTDVKTVSLEPRGLTDVLDNIRLVGELTGTERQARALVARLRDRMDAVRAQGAGPRPRVVCLDWLDPLYAGGHWVPEMVDIAGGVDVLGRRGEPSRIVEWDEVVATRPEVIVLMPCGFDIMRTRVEVPLLSARPGWGDLQAVRDGRIYLTDASSFFNRPGPRLADGLEILAAITHPGRSVRHLPAGAVERL
jgi:iron complex transport system substrate-binding protein